MNKAHLALLTVAAGLATLVAIPSTRWAVLNHASYLWGNRQNPALSTVDEQAALPHLDWVMTDAERNSSDEQIAFGAAYVDVSNYTAEDGHYSPQAKEGPLRRFVERHPRHLAARALLITSVTTVPLVRSETYIPDASALRARKEAAELVLFASEGADRLDPQNAFFPLMRGAALYSLGRKSEAVAQLRLAAKTTHFDEYPLVACNARIAAYEKRYGYHGAQMRLMVHASFLLPHFAVIRNFLLEIARPETPDLQVAAAKACDIMLRTSPTLIGSLSAAGNVRRVLLPRLPFPNIPGAPDYEDPFANKAKRQARENQILRVIARLEATGVDPNRYARTAYDDAQKIQKSTPFSFPLFDNFEVLVGPIRWKVGAGLLMGIFLLSLGAPLLGLLLKCKGTSPHGSFLWANAVWPLAFLGDQSVGVVAAGVLLTYLAFQLAILWKASAWAKRYEVAIGLGGAVVVGGMGFADWPFLPYAAALYALSGLLSRVVLSKPWQKAVVFNLLLLLLVVPISTHAADSTGLRYVLPEIMDLFFIGILMFGAAAPRMAPPSLAPSEGNPPSKAEVPRSSHAWLVALWGVCYLVLVGYEIRCDRSMQLSLADISREAAALRRHAGIE